MEPGPTKDESTAAEPFVRVVVVAPTFNHAAALPAVLEALASTRLPTVVVDDGSTDGTAAVLSRWSGDNRWVLTHRRNAGKGGALQSGFAEARRRGFTHAITMDTDGQHDAADLASLLGVLRTQPASLIIGARTGGDRAPGKSELGRRISNALVRLECGVRVHDSQSGMRVYPLGLTGDLVVRAGRYGFETEVIVRAGWRGIPVVETPIRCIYEIPGGRTTHFRVGRDSLAAAAMHARLLLRGLWPDRARLPTSSSNTHAGFIPDRLLRWLSPVRLWEMLRGAGPERERAAASFGVGAVMAVLPLYGVKTVLCLWLSDRLRLHPLAVIGASSLSTPPIGVVFIATSIWVGKVLLRGVASPMAWSVPEGPVWNVAGSLIAEWVVGSVVLGPLLGAAVYGAVKLAISKGPTRATASEPRPPTGTVHEAPRVR